MEFKLPHINIEKEYTLNIFKLDENSLDDDYQSVFFNFIHDGHSFCSLLDNILYIYGERRPYISLKDFHKLSNIKHFYDCGRKININNTSYILRGDVNCCHISGNYNNSNTHFDQKWKYLEIRKPTDDKINIINTIEKVDKIVEKIVEKIVKVKQCCEINEMDKCSICLEYIASVNFGCCSMNYCGECAIKLRTTTSKCAQCRKTISSQIKMLF